MRQLSKISTKQELQVRNQRGMRLSNCWVLSARACAEHSCEEPCRLLRRQNQSVTPS